ncbi:MAG: hypothetical protein JJ896_15430 [Rhodothermales bacterium]|nr:hypothetical protein [Rhodothermales bacterium]MBO6781046.1 hypothetical protein [Rhodothermales bacterium]
MKWLARLGAPVLALVLLAFWAFHMWRYLAASDGVTWTSDDLLDPDVMLAATGAVGAAVAGLVGVAVERAAWRRADRAFTDIVAVLYFVVYCGIAFWALAVWDGSDDSTPVDALAASCFGMLIAAVAQAFRKPAAPVQVREK